MKNRLGKWGNHKWCSKPTFPPFIQHFGDDVTILSKFIPTYSLEHLKNCGKNTKKLAAGLRILSSLCSRRQSVCEYKFWGWCYYLFRVLAGLNFSWATVNFYVFFSQKLALEKSSGVRLTWSSAMLVILNLTRGLLSLTSMQLPFFFRESQ